MKLVKFVQRYRCEFCKKSGIKRIIEPHEKTCYRNPNRICWECNNTGKVYQDIEGFKFPDAPCPSCKKFDVEKLKEIEEFEKQKYGK